MPFFTAAASHRPTGLVFYGTFNLNRSSRVAKDVDPYRFAVLRSVLSKILALQSLRLGFKYYAPSHLPLHKGGGLNRLSSVGGEFYFCRDRLRCYGADLHDINTKRADPRVSPKLVFRYLILNYSASTMVISLSTALAASPDAQEAFAPVTYVLLSTEEANVIIGTRAITLESVKNERSILTSTL